LRRSSTTWNLVHAQSSAEIWESKFPKETPQIAPVDALRADDDLIVEGEVVDDVYDDGELILNDDEHASVNGLAPFCGPVGQPWADAPGPVAPSAPSPGQGMVPLEQAVTEQTTEAHTRQVGEWSD
jgi:hypothetical protein